MGIWPWFSQNWFDFFTAVGIIGGLWFTAISVFLDARAHRLEAKAHRQTNLLTITRNHLKIWTEYLHNQELRRIRNKSVDLATEPVTEAELVFVTLVIAHMNAVFHGMNHRLVRKYERLHRDMAEFFSLPIPGFVWKESKSFQDEDFVQFIEANLK